MSCWANPAIADGKAASKPGPLDERSKRNICNTQQKRSRRSISSRRNARVTGFVVCFGIAISTVSRAVLRLLLIRLIPTCLWRILLKTLFLASKPGCLISNSLVAHLCKSSQSGGNSLRSIPAAVYRSCNGDVNPEAVVRQFRTTGSGGHRNDSRTIAVPCLQKGQAECFVGITLPGTTSTFSAMPDGSSRITTKATDRQIHLWSSAENRHFNAISIVAS